MLAGARLSLLLVFLISKVGWSRAHQHVVEHGWSMCGSPVFLIPHHLCLPVATPDHWCRMPESPPFYFRPKTRWFSQCGGLAIFHHELAEGATHCPTEVTNFGGFTPGGVQKSLGISCHLVVKCDVHGQFSFPNKVKTSM